MKLIRKIIDSYLMSNIFFGAVVFAIIISQINNVIGPVIMPDEVGYWAAGATFAGLDWSGAMQMAPYYGYGYGFIISFLFVLFKNPIYIFRAAICINALMMVGIYLLANYIIRFLKPSISPLMAGLMGLLVALYPYNIYYSMLTGSEIIQVIIYLLICVLLLQCFNSKKHLYIRMVLLAILGVYMVACHQRNLGVLLVLCFIVFAGGIIKKIDAKGMLLYGVVLVISIILVFYIKDIINQEVYHVVGYTSDEANKVEGALGVFSFIGIKSFIKNVLGRIFYLGCASWLLVYRGAWLVIKEFSRNVVTIFREKKINIDGNVLLKIFVLLSMVVQIAIGALAFLYNSTRVDGFLYGRYNEHVIIPLLILGLMTFDECKKNLRIQVLISMLLGALAILFRYLYYTNRSMYVGAHSISAIAGLPIFNFVNEGNLQFMYSIGVGATCIVLSWLAYIFFVGKTQRKQVVGLLIVVGCWVVIGINSLNLHIYSMKEYNEDLNEFADYINETLDGEDQLYYVIDRENELHNVNSSTWLIYRMRFFLVDMHFDVIDVSEVDNQEYIMVYKASTENQLMTSLNYEIMAEGDRMYLYYKQNNEE